tara:strand:+ start:3646 stop:4380 length:735 start_codon:yes stop_codon:yes gene_type:complete
MFGGHFYHATTRKAVALFGTLFNNISVVRRDGSGEPVNQIKAPLAYGPKQKFIARLDTLGDDQKSMAIKLPRMAFEITSIELDTSTKLNRLSTISKSDNVDPTIRESIKLQTTYTLGFELNIMAKNQDDGLQIVEQILPYFQPEYSVTINPIEGWPEYKEDVPVSLKDVSINDEYQGAMTDRRVLIYTLTFEMKMRYYGPETNPAGVITTIDVNFLDPAFMGQSLANPDVRTGELGNIHIEADD